MWSPEATAIMQRIVPAADTDILLFNGPIERPRDRRLIKLLTKRSCRPNLLMILVTNGGDPDAAYRIARSIQDHYKKFTVCIPGICKSAGTLLLLGAHELAFSENGEIGPLDIQMAKKDELWESESGLTVMTALTALSENAQDAFDHFLVSLTTRSGGRITVRTASEVAAKLTQALYAPMRTRSIRSTWAKSSGPWQSQENTVRGWCVRAKSVMRSA
jgi:membrane-bound ClpP family serine protease